MSRGHQQQVDVPPMAILWDMENCPVPSEVKADDVATNVRKALRQQNQVIHGAVTYFAAYGDFTRFTRKVREGCQRTGVNLIDVPNGKKDASDKAILVDMFLFALDNRPPCTLFLISGDVDFSSALHKLGQRGYTVVLAVPSRVGVSPALLSAGRFVWDWPSLARGVLQVAKHNCFSRPSSRGVGDGRLPEGVAPGEHDARMPEIREIGGHGGHSISSFANSDESDYTANEEEIVWKTTTSSRVEDHTVISTGSYRLDRPRKASFVSPRRNSNSSPASRRALKSPSRRMSTISPAPTRISNRSPAVRSSLPGKPPQDLLVAMELGKVAASSRSMSPCPAARRPQAEAASSVAVDGSQNSAAAGPLSPEDGLYLKEQVMRLLSYNRGEMEVSRLPGEYFKAFGEHLPDCGPNSLRLVAALEKFPDWFFITGEGHSTVLCLTKSGGRAAGKLNKETKNSRKMSVGVAVPEESGFRSTPPPPELQAEDEDLILLQHEEAVEAQNEDLIQLQNEEVVETQKNDLVQAQVRDLADPADELEGEQVVLGLRTQSVHQAASVELQAQNIRAWSMGLQSLKVKTSSQIATISSESPEEKEADSHDNWEVESVRLMIDDNDDGEEEDEDEDVLEEKDGEFEEFTLKGILNTFKVELQDLLVCHGGRVKLLDFWGLYKQRYSRQLEYVKFDVDDLEALIGKVGDVATVRVEKGIKMLVGL